MKIEVVPVLVGLPAVEQRALELDVLREEAGREHAIGDVGGIGPVVGQRREGVVQRGRPVHVGHGADRGLADGRDIRHDAYSAADRPLVHHRQLHEQVVGVLSVVQRLAPVGLPALQQQGIPGAANRQGLGARHAVQMERAAADLAHRHQHAPVDAAELVGAAGAALVVVLQEGVAVDHQHPRAGHEMPRPHRRGVRQPSGAGAHAGHRDAERAFGHVGHGGHTTHSMMLLTHLGKPSTGADRCPPHHEGDEKYARAERPKGAETPPERGAVICD